MTNTELRQWFDKNSPSFARDMGIKHESLKFELTDTEPPVVTVRYKDQEEKVDLGKIDTTEEMQKEIYYGAARDVFISGKEKDFRLSARTAGVNYTAGAWETYIWEIIYATQQIFETERYTISSLYQGRPSLLIDEKDVRLDLRFRDVPSEEIEAEFAARKNRHTEGINSLTDLIKKGTRLDQFKEAYSELGEAFSPDLERLIFRQYPQFEKRIVEKAEGAYVSETDMAVMAVIYHGCIRARYPTFIDGQKERDTFERKLYSIITPIHALLLEKYQQAFLTAREEVFDVIKKDEALNAAEQLEGDEPSERIYTLWWEFYLRTFDPDKKELHKEKSSYEKAIDTWDGRENFGRIYTQAQQDFENGLIGIDKKVYEMERKKHGSAFTTFLKKRGFGI